MKKLLNLSLLFALIFFGAAQIASAQKTAEDGKPKPKNYSEVIQVPGASKDLLHDRGIKTLNTMYKDAAKKITENDKQNGKILLATKTRTEIKDKDGTVRPSTFINYKFSLELKEGKYKYDFYDVHVDEGGIKTPIEKYLEPGNKAAKDINAEKFAYFEEDINRLIGLLKEGMASDKVEVKEDW